MGIRSPGAMAGFALGASILGAAGFVFGVIEPRAEQGHGIPSFDTYAYFYPNVVHALRSLREGGGLLWNPYQAAGHPFFALSLTGLLYPVYWLFAVFNREPALLVSMFVHLVIAGAGMYGLCRQLGLSGVAAVAGAVAFQQSGSALYLASWSPMHLAGYAWLPVVLWLAERLLDRPGVRSALLLAVGLSVQLLAGFPQTVFFTGQLVVLRAIWLAFRGGGRVRAAGWLGLGLTLPLFATAVQYLPSVEVALASVRGGGLTAAEMGAGLDFSALRAPAPGVPAPQSVWILSAMFAAVAVCGRRRARLAAFYWLVAAAYLLLAFGPGTPLFDLYRSLPFGDAFRQPARSLWVTGFAVAMLTAIGVAQIADATDASRPLRGLRMGVLVAGAVIFLGLSGEAWRFDAALAAAAVGVAALAGGASERWRVAGAALPLLLLANGLWAGSSPLLGQRAGDLYDRHASVFRELRDERMTPQDRIFVVGEHGDFSLMPRSGTVYGVPEIHDYEPQTTRSFAEWFVYLRTGAPMQGLSGFYVYGGNPLPLALQTNLLDMLAARFLVVDRNLDRTGESFGGALQRVHSDADLIVYENRAALPRARFVPQLEVVEPSLGLAQLAQGEVDPRQVVVVYAAPASGFSGTPGARGAARFALDTPERLIVEVSATAPGFLVLADQYDAGWRAEVDGAAAEILRANHAFRAVEVPAGDSSVEFTYRPASLRIGALVSLATAAAMALLWLRSRPDRPGGTPAP